MTEKEKYRGVAIAIGMKLIYTGFHGNRGVVFQHHSAHILRSGNKWVLATLTPKGFFTDHVKFDNLPKAMAAVVGLNQVDIAMQEQGVESPPGWLPPGEKNFHEKENT